jgi:hypothetical protein
MSLKINADFRVKFDGELNQVNAQTFINSLFNVSTLVQEIGQEVEPDRTLDLKIVALEPGSFIAGINIHEVATATTSLFRPENASYAANVVVILGGLYKLKQHLGKDKPESAEPEGDSIKVKNNKGTIQLFDNRTYTLYSRNQTVGDAISNSFSTLEDDPSVTGFEILDADQKEIFKAARDDFGDLAVKSEVIDADKKTKVVNADLNLLKVVLEKGRKWEFYYGGIRISADIADEAFFDRIDQGEPFSKGDILKADLQINQIFDPTVNTYIIHSYVVLKIDQHIPRSKQLKIEDFDSPAEG